MKTYYFHGYLISGFCLCGKYQADFRPDAIQVPDLPNNNIDTWYRLQLLDVEDRCEWATGAQHIDGFARPGHYDPDLIVPILFYAGGSFAGCMDALRTHSADRS